METIQRLIRLLQSAGISIQKSAYRKKKTNEDRTLNKESLQRRKWSHTISASTRPAKENDI